jgi:hypothetical protein
MSVVIYWLRVIGLGVAIYILWSFASAIFSVIFDLLMTVSKMIEEFRERESK